MKYFKIKQYKDNYLVITPYREKMLTLLSALHFRFPDKALKYSDYHYGYTLSVRSSSIRSRLKLIKLIENGTRNTSQR